MSDPAPVINTPPNPTPAPPASSNAATRTWFYIFLVLVLIGGLNWGLVSVNQDYDLVALLLGDGSMGARAVYALVGIAAIIVIILSLGNCNAIFATN